MKRCTKCKETKLLKEFSKKSSSKDGLQSSCKECCNRYLKEHRERNPDKHREALKKYNLSNKEKAKEYHLKRLYGITLEQYNELLVKQNHSCAVCKGHEDTFKTRLAVDHDHKTKEIRGLLCNFCNHRVVGRHRNPAILHNAANYLEGPFTGWLAPPKKKKKKRRT